MRNTPIVNAITDVFNEAIRQGCIHIDVEDQEIDGRSVTIRNTENVNFGSCSYLGLEMDIRLREAAADAAMKYGVSFAQSRAYLNLPYYQELEFLLSQIFQAEVVVTATSSLTHISAIPLLIGKQDAVILDHHVHNSVSTATRLLQAQGIHVETLRHGKLDLLRERYEALKQTHEHVWYMVDGVYSMQGDLAPIPELRAMLEELDQFYLYVDDAHGMSWTGKHGCGYAMSHGPIHPKMVVTVSLWKSFGAQGGAIVFPNKEWRNLVRVAGSSLIFSGPIPPMSLAAAVASAKIHLSEEIHEMQRALQSKIQYFNERAAALDLMLLHHNISPVKMIGLGKEDVTMALTSGLIHKGYYVNGVGYPSVPLNQSGLRITITNHVSLEDIDGLLTNMRMMLNEAYEVRNISEEKVKRSFTRNRAKAAAITAGKAES